MNFAHPDERNDWMNGRLLSRTAPVVNHGYGYPQPANPGAVRQIKTGQISTLSKIVSLVGSKLYRFRIAPMIEGYTHSGL